MKKMRRGASAASTSGAAFVALWSLDSVLSSGGITAGGRTAFFGGLDAFGTSTIGIVTAACFSSSGTTAPVTLGLFDQRRELTEHQGIVAHCPAIHRALEWLRL